MACGFSLNSEDNLDELKTRIREAAREKLEGRDLRNFLKIEAVLDLHQTNWELVDIARQFAPYGQANPEPIFLTRGVTVKDFSCVGKTKDHLKMTVEDQGLTRQCIAFKCGEFAEALMPGVKIDIAYAISVNEWNGNREIQLIIKDIEIMQ